MLLNDNIVKQFDENIHLARIEMISTCHADKYVVNYHVIRSDKVGMYKIFQTRD